MTMHNLRRDESGIAAMVVTIVVLIILSITTVGIAAIARREQRQSIDRQLSAEAYYGAESGVNDVIQKLKTTSISAILGAGVGKDCNNPNYWSGNSALTQNSYITTTALGGISAGSQYSCVLLDNKPKSLEYSQLAPDGGTTSEINITTAADPSLTTLVFGWQDYNGVAGSRGACSNLTSLTFPPENQWNISTPILRVDITNLGPGLGRNNLINNTSTYFMYPCPAASFSNSFGAVTFNKTTDNSIVPGQCGGSNNTPQPPDQLQLCNVHVNFPGGVRHVLIRFKTIYRTGKISVTGLTNGKPQSLPGGQIVIDVTAKAADVVKRLQVRYTQNYNFVYALESANSICKLLQFAPNTANYDVPGALNNDPTNVCNPQFN
ncbi:MAG TPA: pilus assembly PilX N-terminal domain-containing protein [Candidatus Saccharimonadales bacterium]|nr:pilus assembly PilX N-terminal domain-containing protein [Candidatus Saccharimonadales bacterium]